MTVRSNLAMSNLLIDAKAHSVDKLILPKNIGKQLIFMISKKCKYKTIPVLTTRSGKTIDVSKYMKPSTDDEIFKVEEVGDTLEYALRHPEDYVGYECDCKRDFIVESGRG